MVDISVAITWIAISAASVKGLSAFARATAASNAEVDLGDALASFEGAPYPLDVPPRLLRDSP
jgi:hypothetical protein